MTFQAATSVEIAAPPATVFAWLTDREKLARWVHADVAMMPDPAQLHPGYTGESNFETPDGTTRKIAYEITSYEPPNLYAYRLTQEGMKTLAEYRLSLAGTGTLLEASTSTEWELDQMTAYQEMQAKAEAQIANAPSFVQDMVRRQMEQAEQQAEAGNPAADEKMKKMFDETLAQLKEAVERGD